MPRRGPEKKYPYNVRLTRQQIAKIKSMGGPEWLRYIISHTQSTKFGRDPVTFIQAKAQRNKFIAESSASSALLAATYNISTKRVQQIRREHKKGNQ